VVNRVPGKHKARNSVLGTEEKEKRKQEMVGDWEFRSMVEHLPRMHKATVSVSSR
jgi:hypothetical protein